MDVESSDEDIQTYQVTTPDHKCRVCADHMDRRCKPSPAIHQVTSYTIDSAACPRT